MTRPLHTCKCLWLAAALLAAVAVLWVHHREIGAFLHGLHWADVQTAVERAGAWGPVVCILLLAGFTLLFLPTTLIVVAVALLFGVGKGLPICLAGFACGMGSAFLLARYFMRDWMEKRIGHTAFYRRMEENIQRDGWKLVVFSRVFPINPYPILNYAYGLSSIRFSTYIICSTIGVMPNLLAFLWTTHAAGEMATGHLDGRILLLLGAGALLFAVLAFLPRLLRKKGPGTAAAGAVAPPIEAESLFSDKPEMDQASQQGEADRIEQRMHEHANP